MHFIVGFVDGPYQQTECDTTVVCQVRNIRCLYLEQARQVIGKATLLSVRYQQESLSSNF